MRYRVTVPAGETVPPLHETEDDHDNLTDSAHMLFVGDLVDVEGDIKDKRRVFLTTVEPTPRKGWFSTLALQPAANRDIDIDERQFYDLLNLLTVGKTDQRYLFALAFAESEIKNRPGLIPGSDAVGPFQYTSAKWAELLASVGTGTGLRLEDRVVPEAQARLAVEEAVEAMKKVEAALSRPALRNELYLLHLLSAGAVDAFLNAVEKDPAPSIEAILTGVPNATELMEQHSKLLKTSGRTATVAEALDLAANALQPGLDRSVELDPPPRVALPPGLTVFQAKCLTYMPDLRERFKLSVEQTAGVFGNLGTESAGFTAFHEKGQPEGKGGYGWAQWTASRRVEFFDWCKRNALEPESDDASYGFLCFELEKKPHSAAITALKLTHSLEDAVEAFEREYEKAGIKGMPSRIAWARKALDIYTNPPQEPVASERTGAVAGTDPRWVTAGLQDVGFHEIGDNQGIEKFIQQARVGSPGNKWCAIWVNAKLAVSGIPGSGSALAASFRKHPNFIRLNGPALGAIVVWNHHVGFYMGQSSSGAILTLGGNQGDMVCQAFEKFDNVPDYWWPKSEPMPQVRVIQVASAAGTRGGRVT